MSYRIAGIDVHKKMLAVVVSAVEVDGEYGFERRMFGSNPEQLRSLAAWLIEQEAEEAVMESTAQYWKPVWAALERYWKPLREKREGASRRSGTLHLAQAQSNRGRRGRKRDFPDAERLEKRLVGRELVLSFVPTAEEHLWRTVTRKKHRLRSHGVRLRGGGRAGVGVRTQRRRSVRRADLRQGPFPRRNVSPRGLVPAPGTTRAGAGTTATDPRRETATCGGYSIRLLTAQPGPKEASSRLSIAARSRAWDIIQPFEPLPIDSAR